MSPQGVAALYGVVTFAILAGIYLAFVNLTLGWPAVPDGSRLQATLMLAWYALAALFARFAGRHAAHGATLGQAWGAALADLGRGAKKILTRS